MEPIVEERKLLRLRLSMTHRPVPDSLRCEVLRGSEPLVSPWTVPLAEFNVVPYSGPAATSGSRLNRVLGDLVSRSTPAAAFTEELQRLADTLDPNEVLWLELARPKGLLPQLPWEEWLHQYVQQPILRVPRFALKPVRPQGRLDLAWCSSSPRAKEEIPVSEHLQETWRALEQAGIEAWLHVFVDARLRPVIAKAFPAPLLESGRIRIYPTPEGHEAEGHRDDSGDARRSPLRNEWLRWMAASLTKRVDLVHFTHHGHLTKGRGALAFAHSPRADDDAQWARLVYADEMQVFLDQLGAVGFGLTSPVSNASVAGLRALADEIVDRRPGPVVFHDSREDHAGDALATALACLYGEQSSPPPSSAVAIYCHPDRLAPKVSDEELQELVEMEVRDLLSKYEYGGEEPHATGALSLNQGGDFDVTGVGTEVGEYGVEAERPAKDAREYGEDDGVSKAGEVSGTEDTGVGSDGRGERKTSKAQTKSPPSPADRTHDSKEVLDWKYLYRNPTESNPTSAGVAVDKAMLSRYTLAQKIQPERFEVVRKALDASLHQGAAPELPKKDESAPPEAWMRSSQRVLERHLAQLGTETLADTVRGRAKQKGAADALRFVADLLGEGKK